MRPRLNLDYKGIQITCDLRFTYTFSRHFAFRFRMASIVLFPINSQVATQVTTWLSLETKDSCLHQFLVPLALVGFSICMYIYIAYKHRKGGRRKQEILVAPRRA